MKIGLIAVGLNTYWHQFGGLRERLDGYRNAIKEKMEAYGGQIVADAGMVDDVDKAHAAAALFRRDEAEVLFIFISTYALSSTLIPFLGEGIPVVLLNLQPAPAIDYARLNGMSDRGEMTGEWLANCQACSLPEFCSVFNRAGTKYDVVTGYLDDAQAWAEIYGWIDAAKVACGMRRNRMGLLGNYYGGMVDVYSDLRLQSTVFGTHAEILEMCELHEFRRSVTQREADARVAAFGEAFVILDQHDVCFHGVTIPPAYAAGSTGSSNSPGPLKRARSIRLSSWMCSSSVSLVVPAISVTMARSSPTSTFIREDFPAFGFPTITVRIPSRIIFPSSKESARRRIFFFSSSTVCASFSLYPSRLICSGSSSADSIYAI